MNRWRYNVENKYYKPAKDERLVSHDEFVKCTLTKDRAKGSSKSQGYKSYIVSYILSSHRMFIICDIISSSFLPDVNFKLMHIVFFYFLISLLRCIIVMYLIFYCYYNNHLVLFYYNIIKLNQNY
jgi:hypothetical protein